MSEAEVANITINGISGRVAAGTSVLGAASQMGIEIPTLCHHTALSPVGSCRLCVVEIEGRDGQHPACVEPVRDGMCVATESNALAAARRFILEMLVQNYVDETSRTGPEGENELRRWLRYYDVPIRDQRETRRRYSVDSDPNPFIRVDLNQCILCTRCVRACDEIQGRFVWDIGQRGHDTRIIAGLDTSLLEARCESCGACVAVCPTGALEDRMSFGLGPPDKKVRTTCGYCGVGCQMDLNIKSGQVVGVSSDSSAPVNGISLCVKGRYGYDFLHHPERLTQPQVRQYLLDNLSPEARPADRGPWVAVDWPQAIGVIAKRMSEILGESGPNTVACLSSAKCTNEENYLMQKLARQVLRTNNVDHCARLCHSSTVAGLGMAFGSGAMSNSMDDIVEHARAVLVIGSNTTEQHPVFGAMLRQAVLRRGVKLVVADPRCIDLAEFATLHLRQRPGTDVALINGLMHLALKNNWHDQEFIAERCEGFADLEQTLKAYSPEAVSQITGISESALQEAARVLCTNRPMAVIWAMGITQHTTGVINVLSLANLQMLLGNLGIAGGGVNPLRGQNNVQGACDMGALPNVFPGYQQTGNPEVREKFASAWRLDGTGSTEAAAGLTVTEMIEAAGRGDVRALYIMGEDPVMTEPDCNHAKQCMSKAEFIVLQEIFPSETSLYADVLLPGAAFAEKSGTFTNTERRIQPVRQAIEPPGNARPDGSILCDVAQTLLERQSMKPTGPYADWKYDSPADILDEIAALTPSYAGVHWSRIEGNERLQWPVTAADHPGTPILHVSQFTRGKGKFHAVEHLPAEELPDADYPLLLTTGRVLYHWHGGELTRRAKGLAAAYPETCVEVSPGDARRLQICDKEPVCVKSRRGLMKARAIVTDRVPEGVVFGSFHFPEEHNVNNLTICALDPVAKIPEYKVCAVSVEAIGAAG
ncbi:MAG: formate dehydrogenase subunit alpha [Planctomycetales bacterium]|nr:formate dehydrogenase subunit alpha [Planctomycetales bacterium]